MVKNNFPIFSHIFPWFSHGFPMVFPFSHGFSLWFYGHGHGHHRGDGLRLGLGELLAQLQHHSARGRRDARKGLLELCREHPGVLNVAR